jgi:hypothetical protein
VYGSNKGWSHARASSRSSQCILSEGHASRRLLYMRLVSAAIAYTCVRPYTPLHGSVGSGAPLAAPNDTHRVVQGGCCYVCNCRCASGKCTMLALASHLSGWELGHGPGFSRGLSTRKVVRHI